MRTRSHVSRPISPATRCCISSAVAVAPYRIGVRTRVRGLAGVGTALAGPSALAVRLFFQGLEAAALAGVLWIVWQRTRSPAALAFVGLNPAILIVINGGHNDLLVGLALLGGLVLLADGRPRLAGVVLAMGALVKLVLLLPIAALVFWSWHRRGSRVALEVGSTVGALVVGAYALAGGPAALAPLLHARAQHSRSAVWQLAVRWLLQRSARWGPGVASTIGDLALVTIALVAVVVVVRVRRVRAAAPICGRRSGPRSSPERRWSSTS